MRRFSERVMERLGLPEELLDGTMRLTMTGGKQVRIENHQSLLEFTSEVLEVAAGRQRLRVIGEGLRIISMDSTALLAEGRILTVEVESA